MDVIESIMARSDRSRLPARRTLLKYRIETPGA
jgi:hypothetical protein